MNNHCNSQFFACQVGRDQLPGRIRPVSLPTSRQLICFVRSLLITSATLLVRALVRTDCFEFTYLASCFAHLIYMTLLSVRHPKWPDHPLSLSSAIRRAPLLVVFSFESRYLCLSWPAGSAHLQRTRRSLAAVSRRKHTPAHAFSSCSSLNSQDLLILGIAEHCECSKLQTNNRHSINKTTTTALSRLVFLPNLKNHWPQGSSALKTCRFNFDRFTICDLFISTHIDCRPNLNHLISFNYVTETISNRVTHKSIDLFALFRLCCDSHKLGFFTIKLTFSFVFESKSSIYPKNDVFLFAPIVIRAHPPRFVLLPIANQIPTFKS